MTFNNLKYQIQNRIVHFFTALLVLTFLSSCCKDDGPNNRILMENQEETENSIYGQWNVLSGNLSFGKSKFILFNADNTMHLLEESDSGFKSELLSNITIEKDTITIVKAEQGSRTIGYELDGDKLALTQEFGSNVRLERASEILNSTDWIKTVSVLDKRNLSQSIKDITYDGEHILACGFWENKIQLIDAQTFETVGSIDAQLGIAAIDMEKSDYDFRQLFKGFGNTEGFTASGFSSYIYNSNERYYSSNGISGTITGLASEKPSYIWAASDEKEELYYYKSNGSLRPGELLETFSLDFRPTGLDYRDGFLYIVSYGYIYKCSITTELQIIQTFKIPGYSLNGITHDGTNFILSTYDYAAGTYALLRTDF